jgi:hypothetical protein
MSHNGSGLKQAECQLAATPDAPEKQGIPWIDLEPTFTCRQMLLFADLKTFLFSLALRR